MIDNKWLNETEVEQIEQINSSTVLTSHLYSLIVFVIALL